MPQSASPPAFTAVLFGLSGCLVDFGARAASLAMQRLPSAVLQDGSALRSLDHAYAQQLQQSARSQAEPTPGAMAILQALHEQGTPCAWLDELPHEAGLQLAAELPHWLPAISTAPQRPWPAPDACWQALSALQVERLDGCVLVSGEPRLLQAGLNAGLWTVGLAACGSLGGHALADWQALDSQQRDLLRAEATLALYRMGAHSVIDQLSDLRPCLDDLAARRGKGEKP
ncbi:HAD family phosphatase [Phytopseudomonas dryadis]|uniref:phosphoglycolate phosphatase n=1 Tax=Phytopseudomonas dryadis TaxID=2487520 RepID=A0A4V2KBI5_9GAMM|nr:MULTISPECIES: HAD family phosphatase [Pseudomonas]TBU85673.1 phosphatase [Pseudomonas dryadis]TBV09489.1 phosphatase [Pseudomonas dryadis]TBV18676.1 phosphatase [Pseudomonas sp. FRB 230]